MDERDHKAMNEELNQPSCLGAVSGSYVVYEDSHEHEALIQLSVHYQHLKEQENMLRLGKARNCISICWWNNYR